MKIIVFKDGSTRAVTGDAGKYWLIGEDRVRKLSGSIAEVRELPDAQTDDIGEKPVPKKKTARKKKATEVKDDGERGE